MSADCARSGHSAEQITGSNLTEFWFGAGGSDESNDLASEYGITAGDQEWDTGKQVFGRAISTQAPSLDLAFLEHLLYARLLWTRLGIHEEQAEVSPSGSS